MRPLGAVNIYLLPLQLQLQLQAHVLVKMATALAASKANMLPFPIVAT